MHSWVLGRRLAGAGCTHSTPRCRGAHGGMVARLQAGAGAARAGRAAAAPCCAKPGGAGEGY